MLIWFSIKFQSYHAASYGQGNGSCILRKYNHHFFVGIIAFIGNYSKELRMPEHLFL